MSTPTCITKNPLQRDGTSRHQRLLEALDPSYAPVHEFGLREWMLFAWQYAGQLNFFDVSDDTIVRGDWSGFMMAEREIEEFVTRLQKKNDPQNVEPHLALFVSFIKLLEPSRDMMNGITRRHLHFYYEEVLKIQKRAPQPDKVNLVFNLAKNMLSHQLEENSRLDAGKDQGRPQKPLEYMVSGSPVIYKATADLFKSVYHNKANKYLAYAPMANSMDGNGAALDKNNPLWYAFGFDQLQVSKTGVTHIKMPVAKAGFALASPVLQLQEGERKVTVKLDLDFPASANYQLFNDAAAAMIILLTGEKGWMTPTGITIDKKPVAGSTQWIFSFTVGSAEKGIVAWNKKLHQENYNTESPVMRVLFETRSDGGAVGYDIYSLLAATTIIKATIDVEVKGMRNLQLENDEGRLDPARPFLPFGSIPRKGSDFYVGSPEIFNKAWKNITLGVTWKNKPADIAAHYYAYRDIYLTNKFSRSAYNLTKDANPIPGTALVTGDAYFTLSTSYIKNNHWSNGEVKQLFDSTITVTANDTPEQKPVNTGYNFPRLFATAFEPGTAYIRNYLQATPVRPPFIQKEFDPGYERKETVAEGLTAGTKNNFLRLKLQNDFFHASFPVLYAAALTISGAIIPKEPYTPQIESLVVGYTATEENDFLIGNRQKKDILNNYRQRKIQLFHETPFGQGEQHIFLKEQQSFIVNNTSLRLAPTYESEGEFYIGISNLVPETILSLLFQVAEGSENPLSGTFTETTAIQWYMLCNNEWKYLNDNFILSDDTGNFLRPGIIKFLVPAEANNGNTVLPAEYYWLKAQLPAGAAFDSVCKFVAVYAQAHTADFIDNGNELSHLSTALPVETISKMVSKQPAIKSITQPFSSFGGRAAETDAEYYMRVSERLRHKNRAVNIWDYERLVLEKFPAVYKVKCLNHTSSTIEMAPGFVRVIPIPDLRNRNIYNKYQPRVSKNTLTQVQAFLNDLCGFHVDCKAENPDFEEVQFELKVKFRDGYDPRAYVKILDEDLKKYLSPWAFNQEAAVQFGGTIHKSQVIAYAEERGYVDFITDFKMYNLKFGMKSKDEIAADSSRAILTSAPQHIIAAIQPPVC